MSLIRREKGSVRANHLGLVLPQTDPFLFGEVFSGVSAGRRREESEEAETSGGPERQQGRCRSPNTGLFGNNEKLLRTLNRSLFACRNTSHYCLLLY